MSDFTRPGQIYAYIAEVPCNRDAPKVAIRRYVRFMFRHFGTWAIARRTDGYRNIGEFETLADFGPDDLPYLLDQHKALRVWAHHYCKICVGTSPLKRVWRGSAEKYLGLDRCSVCQRLGEHAGCSIEKERIVCHGCYLTETQKAKWFAEDVGDIASLLNELMSQVNGKERPKCRSSQPKVSATVLLRTWRRSATAGCDHPKPAPEPISQSRSSTL